MEPPDARARRAGSTIARRRAGATACLPIASLPTRRKGVAALATAFPAGSSERATRPRGRVARRAALSRSEAEVRAQHPRAFRARDVMAAADAVDVFLVAQ